MVTNYSSVDRVLSRPKNGEDCAKLCSPVLKTVFQEGLSSGSSNQFPEPAFLGLCIEEMRGYDRILPTSCSGISSHFVLETGSNVAQAVSSRCLGQGLT